MATASLTSRIDKLINDLGGTPKPGPVDIRNRLTAFSTLAEALESGQSAVEAEQKIAVLEASVSALKAERDGLKAEGEKLQAALDSTRDEIRRIQNQTDENEPLSSIETRILRYVDRTGQGFEEDLAEPLAINKWVAQRMLSDLCKAGFLTAEYDPDGDPDTPPIYYLAKKGKAWLEKAGGELEEDATKILLTLAERSAASVPKLSVRIGLKEALIQHHLDEMKDTELVDSSLQYTDEEMLGYDTVWGICRKGRAYLAKRGLLK